MTPALLSNIWNGYRTSALRNNLDWNISFDQFTEIIDQPCNYCGLDTHNHRHLTRLDPNLGFSLDNLVPCCKSCLAAKGTASHEAFMDYIRRVVSFYAPSGGSTLTPTPLTPVATRTASGATITLRAKPLNNGRQSLYYEVYRNGVRAYKFLNLYLTGDPIADAATRAVAESRRNAVLALVPVVEPKPKTAPVVPAEEPINLSHLFSY